MTFRRRLYFNFHDARLYILPTKLSAKSINYKLSGDKWRCVLAAARGFESPTKGLWVPCVVAVEQTSASLFRCRYSYTEGKGYVLSKA